MTTQNEYTPKLEMDRTTVDGLISSQLKLFQFMRFSWTRGSGFYPRKGFEKL